MIEEPTIFDDFRDRREQMVCALEAAGYSVDDIAMMALEMSRNLIGNFTDRILRTLQEKEDWVMYGVVDKANESALSQIEGLFGAIKIKRQNPPEKLQ